MGQYLVMNKNEQQFTKWVHGFGANAKQARDCTTCVKGWSDNNM